MCTYIYKKNKDTQIAPYSQSQDSGHLKKGSE